MEGGWRGLLRACRLGWSQRAPALPGFRGSGCRATFGLPAPPSRPAAPITHPDDQSNPSTHAPSLPCARLPVLSLLQYTARLHADKLKVALCELGGRKFGRQYYNMRLAPEEVRAVSLFMEHG